MRKQIELLLAVVAAGCVHQPALTPKEQCATNGMVLSGMAISSGEASGIAWNGQMTVVARGNSYGEAMQCSRAVTREEQCELRAAIVSAGVKGSFATGWRDALIVAGVVLWVVPGIVLGIVFDGQSDKAGDDAWRAGNAARARCLQPDVPSGPPGAY